MTNMAMRKVGHLSWLTKTPNRLFDGILNETQGGQCSSVAPPDAKLCHQKVAAWSRVLSQSVAISETFYQDPVTQIGKETLVNFAS